MSAVERWRRELEAWAIPAPILESAPESPYGFPVAPFRTRAERAVDAAPTPTTRRALDALPHGGSVLDVGCGGGATSLPLAGRTASVIGVDAQEDMLEGFLTNARAAGVDASTVLGRWPDVAPLVPPVDVGVAGHVLYNVPDLEPFVRALIPVARRRVVFEITGGHPLSWMNDLWLRFHAVERPAGPDAQAAVDALRELGLEPHVERWSSPPRPGGFQRRSDAIALVRRRLCLDPSRDPELEAALGERLTESDGLWSAGETDPPPLASIWFDP